MKKVVLLLSAIALFSAAAFAQVRPVDKDAEKKANAAPAPESFAARYEGGLFGYPKEAGTLKFDDINDRLIFFGKEGKETFSMPYASMLIIYPQSQSVTSTTGNVVKWVPLPGAALLGGLIKEKRRYLIVHFDDPDVEAKGVINFKLETKELLDSVLEALADKAKMVQRGEAYYKPRPKTITD
jgi:hypothetical protein